VLRKKQEENACICALSSLRQSFKEKQKINKNTQKGEKKKEKQKFAS
jgi:hypothetical protein